MGGSTEGQGTGPRAGSAAGHEPPAREHAVGRRRAKGGEEARPTKGKVQGLQQKAEGVDQERAVLVGCGREAPSASGNLHMLDELAELSRTAGAEVLGRVWQRLDRPHPGSYIGSGKVVELKELCDELEANLVVADTELSPAQVRHLEKELDLRVIDRSELIIDIFATHARTRQARLQVELAQLEYLSPRLKRMWTHLSRIAGAGGIGSRGPGEKQIEVDRRIISKRIRDLKAELSEIEKQRERQVGARDTAFKVALVGYTNAGKSTLMRALTGSDVLVADQLFATLDTRTRRWRMGEGLEALLSDTVGFIEKLPHRLVASFHATLEEVREADLLLHVVDAGDPDVDKKVRVVREVLKQIEADGVPELLVLNKADLIPDPVEATIIAGRLEADVMISAVRKEGVAELRDKVSEQLSTHLELVDLEVPATDGKTLALLARVARVVSQEYVGETCRMRASIPSAALGRVEAYLVGGAASRP